MSSFSRLTPTAPAPTSSMLRTSPLLSGSVFAKSPPTGIVAAMQNALATPATPSPGPLSTFIGAPPPPIPPVSSGLLRYTPPSSGSTTLPIASQDSPHTSVGGIFARLSGFSSASPAPSWSGSPPSLRAPVRGLDAAPVATAVPSGFGAKLAAVASIAPFDPPASSPAPAPSPFQPPAAPPVTAAVSLPSGNAAAAGQGGGFDPGSGWNDGQYLDPPADAAPAPASSGPTLGTLALYGGGAIVGLYMLSQIFGGRRAYA